MNHEVVSFSQMKDATQADYDLLNRKFDPYLKETSNRILEALEKQAF